MAWKYKDRYGLPGHIVGNLNDYYCRKGLRESDFGSFDSFVKWCSENGYQPMARLRKHDENKPHGPDNSYWYVKPPYQPVPKHDYTSPFCEGCRQNKDCLCGCSEWEKYFVKNWNENICRKPKEIVPEKPMVFCYEHPDLVREGIVFEAPR